MLKWIAIIVSAALLAVAGLVVYLLNAFDVTPPPLAGSLRQVRVEAGGLEWEFQYYLSDNLPENAPIVFVLHGSGMSGPQVRAAYGYRFDLLADSEDLLPVYPTGFDNHWNDCRDGADYAANVQDVDDIALFRAVIDYLVAEHRADRERVLVTGLSNGGHMAYRLALEAPELVTAIAPIAASLPVWEETDCPRGRQSVPTAIINGTRDPVNPYGGGLVSILGNDSRGTVMSSRETAEYFAGLAGHTTNPDTVTLPDRERDDVSTIELTTWRAPGLDEVRLYTVVGGGHTVPSRTATMPAFLVGPTNADIEAADEIWTFFRQVSGAGSHRP
jgi:polyhydroxybutyrate depolymerase